MNIYIANIPFKANENEVRELFERYGQVASVKIILDRETQKSRGFGFITMNDDKEATQAIEALNGYNMMGKTLSVSEARPKEPSSDNRDRGNREFRPHNRPYGGGGNDRGNSSNYQRPGNFVPPPAVDVPDFTNDKSKISKSRDIKKDKPERNQFDAEKKLKKEVKNQKYKRFSYDDEEEDSDWKKYGKF